MANSTKDWTYKAVTAAVLEALERGVAPWTKSWDDRKVGSRQMSIRGRPYHGMNQLALFARRLSRGYASRTWATFRAVGAAGGRVLKGEPGTWIMHWDMNRTRSEDVLDADGNPTGETRIRRVPVIRVYKVWNLSQTTLPVPEIDAAPAVVPPASVPADVLARMAHPPRIEVGSRPAYLRSEIGRKGGPRTVREVVDASRPAREVDDEVD